MTHPTAIYEDPSLNALPDAHEPFGVFEDEQPTLVFDADEFEIPAEPPDDGSWFDTWIACPGSFEIPRNKDPIPPPLEL